MDCTQHKDNIGDLCIPDSGTTHTILKNRDYFSEIKPTEAVVKTISGPVDLIEGIGKAKFLLPNGTKFTIDEALFSPKSTRNLLSFDDIYRNGYDTQSVTINGNKYLNIVSCESGKIQVLERLPKLPTGLHYTYIHVIESHMAVKEKSHDPSIINLWHDRLGHPGSVMMRRIIEN